MPQPTLIPLLQYSRSYMNTFPPWIPSVLAHFRLCPDILTHTIPAAAISPTNWLLYRPWFQLEFHYLLDAQNLKLLYLETTIGRTGSPESYLLPYQDPSRSRLYEKRVWKLYSWKRLIWKDSISIKKVMTAKLIQQGALVYISKINIQSLAISGVKPTIWVSRTGLPLKFGRHMDGCMYTCMHVSLNIKGKDQMKIIIMAVWVDAGFLGFSYRYCSHLHGSRKRDRNDHESTRTRPNS